MASSLVKSVMLRIVANDGDTQAKLDEISRKAEELGREHPDIKVRIDAAAASAKMRVLRSELKAAADEADNANRHFNFSALKGLIPAVGQMNLFQKAMLGLGAATTFAEPLMAGVVVAAGGLASGLTAAGAGLGVFGLVAKSVYSQVSTAVQSWGTATSTSGKAATAAMAKYHAELAALPPSQQEVAKSIVGVKSAWQDFVASNTAGVGRIMSQGFGLLPGLFKDMQGFLPGTESALHNIIGDLGRGMQSSGFQSFIHVMQANAGPALQKIAILAGHVAVGIGGILKAFMPVAQQMLSGLDHITAKFAQWGQTLSSHSGFQSLMQMFRTETPMAVGVLKNLGGIIKSVIADMTGLSGVGNSKSLLQIAEPFTSLLRVLVQANPDLVRMALYALAIGKGFSQVSNVFGGVKSGFQMLQTAGTWVTTLASKMGILATATEGEAAAQDSADVAIDANPIGAIVIAIAALVAGLVLVVTHLHETAHVFDIFRHAVATAFDWIKSHWKLLLPIIAGPVGLAVALVVSHWHQLVNATHQAWSDIVSFLHSVWSDIVNGLHVAWSAMVNAVHSGWSAVVNATHQAWSDVISALHSAWSAIVNAVSSGIRTVLSFFSSLPGRIVGFLASLPSMMFNAGVHAMEGLIHGLGSMLGSLGSIAGSIASKIAGFIGLSPAREGPLSGSGAPFIRGQHISADIAAGILSGRGAVGTAAGRLAGTVAGTRFGTALGAGAAGSPLVIELHGSDSQFMSALASQIRVRGGDPRILVHKVKLA